MSSRSGSVEAALELLVPPFANNPGDWDEIVRRANEAVASALPVSARPARRPRRVPRRLIIAAVTMLVLAALVVTPAFGLRSLIAGLFDRTDVPFTGASAPLEVKRDFYDLSLGAPPSMAPQAIPSQARRVATFRFGGKARALWVAPTRDGGYCYMFANTFGGCRTSRDRTGAAAPSPGYVHPERLGVTFETPVRDKVPYVSRIGGDIRIGSADSLTVRYAEGSATPVRFYYVSKPIDAGFFLASIPVGHDTTATRATAIELRDKAGRLLARQLFVYEDALSLTKRRKLREALESARRMPPPIRHSPNLPSPTAPLQRGEAGGVSVLVGKNNVAVFDISGATPSVRKLIAGRQVGYYCYRRLPYHTTPVGLGDALTTFGNVAIRLRGGGVRSPVIGCDIQGTYGHTWPDRLGGHSAVEIALTPAGRRFFEDRAAARDLALFVRSRPMHETRKLSGPELRKAILTRYGAAITELSSPRGTPATGQVGYVTDGANMTFVRQSTTGRRFFVRLVDGRIRAQNVKPLGFVF